MDQENGDGSRPVPKLCLTRQGRAHEDNRIQNPTLVAGRVRANDIVIHGDFSVSREHCRFDYDATTGQVTVADLASCNGTYVNGVLIGKAPVVLRPGDKVLVGATVITYGQEYPASGEHTVLPSHLPRAPWPPKEDEEKLVRFVGQVCHCGRCGSVFTVAGCGSGSKVGCRHCRAVWRTPKNGPREGTAASG
jgi:hypothetical protein